MLQQELRPAWCGSLPNAFTTPKQGFLYWSEDRGWLVFCCQECLCSVRRVGWHQKPVTLKDVDRGKDVVHIDRADLDKERAEGRAERNRLARKVNALLGKLSEDRYMAAHLLASERENTERVQVKRDALATENESLRKALEDLGQKNDALAMDKAELAGDLEDRRHREEEEDFHRCLAADKRQSEQRELYTRLYYKDLAIKELTEFVFQVLDQYEESLSSSWPLNSKRSEV